VGNDDGRGAEGLATCIINWLISLELPVEARRGLIIQHQGGLHRQRRA
jgi:hypothetical protein